MALYQNRTGSLEEWVGFRTSSLGFLVCIDPHSVSRIRQTYDIEFVDVTPPSKDTQMRVAYRSTHRGATMVSLGSRAALCASLLVYFSSNAFNSILGLVLGLFSDLSQQNLRSHDGRRHPRPIGVRLPTCDRERGTGCVQRMCAVVQEVC